MNNINLNNSTTIPAVGIGTFMLEPKDAEKAVIEALHDGYRLIDTANAYMNEKAVGRGIKASGLKRDEIYLSTKLWPSVYANPDEAINDTLKRLDTDYIDLLFLHQPIGDYIGAYHAIERAVKSGKVKSIGLSNFSIAQIKEVINASEIKPAVLQVEAHPYYPQNELKQYLQEFGAVIMAWYPLGHGDTRMLQEPLFKKLAAKYGKTTAQIVLHWHIQTGNIVIPGSKNPKHIQDNIDLFDFELTDEEMKEIASLDCNEPYYTATEEALESFLRFIPNFEAQE